MTINTSVTPEFINILLEIPSQQDRVSTLRTASLLNAAGLFQLLDAASDMIGNNPGQARQILLLCIETADVAQAPAVAPNANYLCAQTYAINGELAQARAFIEKARDQYLAIGQQTDALRTNVGLISVLAEIGEYQVALNLAETTLIKITERQDVFNRKEAQLITAAIYRNLGICYELKGQYEDALLALAQADAIYQEFDMIEDQVSLTYCRGSILLNLGRGREALSHFREAAHLADQIDNQLQKIQILNNMGNAYLLLSKYGQSLETLKEARRLVETLDASLDHHIQQGLMADVYLSLNLYPEALVEYHAANEGLTKMGLGYQRAWVLWGLGATYIAQMDWATAVPVLDEAAELFAQAGNQQLQASVMLEQADLLDQQNERGQALQLAQRAQALVSGGDWPVQQAYCLLRLADLVLPDMSLAESLLRDAQQIMETLALPHLRYRTRQRLGHLYLLQERYEDAETLLQAAISEIEQHRGDLAQETVRASFLRDKLMAYEDLIQLYLIRGNEESLQKALQITEQTKSRTLIEFLHGLVETKQLVDNEPEKQQQLETLQADLNIIYNQALRGTHEGERGIRWQMLHQKAKSLEDEISRIRLELADHQGTPMIGETASIVNIQAQLPPTLTVLSYHLLGEEILVFIFQAGHLHVQRHLASAAAIQCLLQELDMEWTRFQADPIFLHRQMAYLERSVQQVLYRLYQYLIQPIEEWLPSSDMFTPELAIVPHGFLHQIPFQALFNGKSYLIDDFEIVYAPNVSLLTHRQQAQSARNNQMGVFAVSDSLIPHVTNEARTIANIYPETNLYLNDAATLEVFREQIKHFGLLHLACHGLFRPDSPMFSSLQLYDGWLTAIDVMSLDLKDTFVTLSACESGRSDALRSDEILGLTRAFLGAGAQAIVVSLWLVEDITTATLMTDFYEHLYQGDGTAAALRRAQQKLRAQYPHPYYWAPFIVVGQTTINNHPANGQFHATESRP
ncbi:MAG: CHAT domain-containing protein [Chloroflexota bacterium]